MKVPTARRLTSGLVVLRAVKLCLQTKLPEQPDSLINTQSWKEKRATKGDWHQMTHPESSWRGALRKSGPSAVNVWSCCLLRQPPPPPPPALCGRPYCDWQADRALATWNLLIGCAAGKACALLSLRYGLLWSPKLHTKPSSTKPDQCSLQPSIFSDTTTSSTMLVLGISF